MTTGVIVGRFQTPYLHEGHLHLIDTAQAENTLVFIIIGCTYDNAIDDRNPYTFDQRYEMIRAAYPKAMIGIINDEPGDNLTWSQKLDSMLEDCIQPTLYGSRDSFHKHYQGRYPFRAVEEIPGISATKIREALKK